MDFSRAVFPGGIEARIQGNEWHVIGNDSHPFASIESVIGWLGELPVLMSFRLPPEAREMSMLLNPLTRRGFEVEVSELSQHLNVPGQLFHVRYLQYLFGCLNYHCKQLVDLYVACTSRSRAIAAIPGFGSEGHAMFQGQEELYFEFDAIVSVALRLYDAPGALLWNIFEAKRGQCPKHIPQVLTRCRGLSTDLRDRLQASWDRFGPKLKAYRDCVQHHTSLEMGLGSVDVMKGANGLWSTLVRIPDNPEVKSRQGFTFAGHNDALRYSMTILAEHAGNVAAIAGVLPRAGTEASDRPV